MAQIRSYLETYAHIRFQRIANHKTFDNTFFGERAGYVESRAEADGILDNVYYIFPEYFKNTIAKGIPYNAGSDTWEWENHEVSEEEFGKAYESLENVVNILEYAKEAQEEKEAGIKLLTRFDILKKYDIKYGDFKEMSRSSLFPKHYDYDGAWMYVETEIQAFLKDYEASNELHTENTI